MASQQTPKQTPQQTPGGSHNRGFSFHVNYSTEEITNIAREIKEETVADVHMSLFTYWVCEKSAHFKEAKKHIRELGLDQVSTPVAGHSPHRGHGRLTSVHL